MKFPLHSIALALGLSLASLAHAAPAQPAQQYFPLTSFRVGPYAAGGSGFFGGFIDYMRLINERDGGVNGVKLTWTECETEWNVERGIECYERMKGGHQGAPASVFNPYSVGILYALLERATTDKIPLITINHGRTDTTDGRVFPYIFPLQLNPYSEVSAIVNYIGQQTGGLDKLKGKKITVVYHGSPYGRKPSRSSTCWRKNTVSRPNTSKYRTPATSSRHSGWPSAATSRTG